MCQTTVVNLRSFNYDVYIGRGSIWGNPFTHIKSKKTLATYVVATRDEAIFAYEEYIRNKPELLAQLYSLVGKRLGCYCKPESCHGDILIKLMQELNLI